jgi:hypothetical protein
MGLSSFEIQSFARDSNDRPPIMAICLNAATRDNSDVNIGIGVCVLRHDIAGMSEVKPGAAKIPV